MTDKYRVNEIVKFNYSDIGEYIDEYHTDRPLRNDILVKLLNDLYEENQRLHDEVFQLRTELAYDRTVNDGKDWFKAEDEHLKWKSGENE